MKTKVILCTCSVLAALTMSCRSESEGNAHGPTTTAPPAGEEDFHKTKGRTPEGHSAETMQLQTPINADTVFSTRCATCHGSDGKGTGPASAALNPKPRDYSDPEWQKSVTDEEIKKTIVEGGPAVGKSPLMAPNPDLANQPAVLDGLVKIVRSFGNT